MSEALIKAARAVATSCALTTPALAQIDGNQILTLAVTAGDLFRLRTALAGVDLIASGVVPGFPVNVPDGPAIVTHRDGRQGRFVTASESEVVVNDGKGFVVWARANVARIDQPTAQYVADVSETPEGRAMRARYDLDMAKEAPADLAALAPFEVSPAPWDSVRPFAVRGLLAKRNAGRDEAHGVTQTIFETDDAALAHAVANALNAATERLTETQANAFLRAVRQSESLLSWLGGQDVRVIPERAFAFDTLQDSSPLTSKLRAVANAIDHEAANESPF